MANSQASFQHPVMAIQNGVQQFSFKTQPITLRLEPGEFDLIKAKLDTEVNKYTNFTKAAIEQFDLASDTEIKKYQDDGKRDILFSALSTDFLTKHHADLIYEDTYDKLMKFITDVIGPQSSTTRRKIAEEKMSNLTRDSDADEKFSRFLTRLQRLAKLVTDTQVIQDFLVNKYFQNSISPSLRSFLREREKNTESPEHIADFLDKLGKNKKTADVKSIEIFGTQTIIKEMRDQFDAKFDALQSEMREILRLQKSNYTDQHVELHAVRAVKPQVKKNTQSTLEEFPPHWEINRYGRPFRCRKCGLRGHRDENCRGTNLTCRLCQEVGHITPACPKRALKSTSKN